MKQARFLPFQIYFLHCTILCFTCKIRAIHLIVKACQKSILATVTPLKNKQEVVQIQFFSPFQLQR